MTSTERQYPQVENSIAALMTSLVTGYMVPEHIDKTHDLFVSLREAEGHTWSDYERGYVNACLQALSIAKILGDPRG